MAGSYFVFSTGKQYGRGGALTEGDVDSTFTNIGGPGIYIAATKIDNFCPDFIARYRGTALNNEYNCGWARVCIATQTAINTDGGLYARDSIQDHSALYDIGIKSFGTGLLGNATLSSGLPYVNIKVGDGTTPSTGERYYAALSTLPSEFKKGRMVLYHDSLDNIYCDHITKIEEDKIFVSRGTPFFDKTGESTWNQLIYVPEYRNLTLQGTINLGTYDFFNDGHGGVIAIACSETLDLTQAAIIAGTGKNGDSAQRPGAGNREATADPRHGNAYHYNKLHLGQGLGAIFILAKNLRVSASTIIGSNLGVKANLAYNSSSYPGGFGSGGAYVYNRTSTTERQGGWYCNGKASYTGTAPGPQGAHLFIVADKIIATSNFKLSDILATGGYGSYSGNGYGYMYNWGRSPCGRGGDAINRVGGYPGGGAEASGDTSGRPGGGAAGACFIYCNQYEVES